MTIFTEPPTSRKKLPVVSFAGVPPLVGINFPLGMIWAPITDAMQFAKFMRMPPKTIAWLSDQRSGTIHADKENGDANADLLAWGFWHEHKRLMGQLPAWDEVLLDWPTTPLHVDELCRKVGYFLCGKQEMAGRILGNAPAGWKHRPITSSNQLFKQYESRFYYISRICQWISHYDGLHYDHLHPRSSFAKKGMTPKLGTPMVPMEVAHAR